MAKSMIHRSLYSHLRDSVLVLLFETYFDVIDMHRRDHLKAWAVLSIPLDLC